MSYARVRNDLRATNFLPLSISFNKIDRNPEFFRQIYRRGSYIDAAYAFATHQTELLTEIGTILASSRQPCHAHRKEGQGIHISF